MIECALVLDGEKLFRGNNLPNFHSGWKYVRFDLNVVDEKECFSHFWFIKQDILHWYHVFGFLDTMKTLNCHVIWSVEAHSTALK